MSCNGIEKIFSGKKSEENQFISALGFLFVEKAVTQQLFRFFNEPTVSEILNIWMHTRIEIRDMKEQYQKTGSSHIAEQIHDLEQQLCFSMVHLRERFTGKNFDRDVECPRFKKSNTPLVIELYQMMERQTPDFEESIDNYLEMLFAIEQRFFRQLLANQVPYECRGKKSQVKAVFKGSIPLYDFADEHMTVVVDVCEKDVEIGIPSSYVSQNIDLATVPIIQCAYIRHFDSAKHSKNDARHTYSYRCGLSNSFACSEQCMIHMLELCKRDPKHIMKCTKCTGICEVIRNRPDIFRDEMYSTAKAYGYPPDSVVFTRIDETISFVESRDQHRKRT
jgi:hypothetical protein